MDKIIHYIWLGKQPKTKLIKKCISSWKNYLPDWEIMEWNEDNLNIDICQYCRQAYNAKKYAFASDVLRFYILEKYGGLYMDVDVELIKPIDDLLNKYDSFSGFEYNKITIAPGLILYAKYSHNKVIHDLLKTYENEEFLNDDVPKTVCERMTEYLVLRGMKNNNELQTIRGFTVFPATYFCPTNNIWSVQLFSNETRSIHHYNASWLESSKRNIVVIKFICKCIGPLGIKAIKKIRKILVGE